MEFRSPADEFPLGTVFENLPEVTVELERLIPHERFIIPYFWVRGAEARDIEAAFEAHAGLVDIELIDHVEVCIEVPHPLDAKEMFAVIDLKDSDFAANVGDMFQPRWDDAEPLEL
jgi:hypothetical protein